MIDNYVWFSIILRSIAEVIFIAILIQQLLVFRHKSQYRYMQVLLIIALFSLAFGNGFTLISNFFRDGTGNLQKEVRHANLVLNGVFTLGAAVALYLINKFKLK